MPAVSRHCPRHSSVCLILRLLPAAVLILIVLALVLIVLALVLIVLALVLIVLVLTVLGILILTVLILILIPVLTAVLVLHGVHTILSREALPDTPAFPLFGTANGMPALPRKKYFPISRRLCGTGAKTRCGAHASR